MYGVKFFNAEGTEFWLRNEADTEYERFEYRDEAEDIADTLPEEHSPVVFAFN